MSITDQLKLLDSIVVTAEQMREIEALIFKNGMPVAALMEKVAILLARRIQELYPLFKTSKIGVLVGPGHNGGDALVIARELYLQGYDICLYRPFSKLKELTLQHANYAHNLGITCYQDIKFLEKCELIIDGLFGFGLTRSLSENIAKAVDIINQSSIPIISIDIPSGLHTDTGEVLGTAIKATYSFCLGLWKPIYFQDQALDYIGKAERIDFGIPPQDVWAILPKPAPIKQLTLTLARQFLPLRRPLLTHKYKQGHLLLICGSRRYAGGSILTGLGARSSGVGMLSIAIPESLKPLLVSQLPDALIIECPETETGTIARLPPLATAFDNYDVIACGPGLTLEATSVVEQVLTASCPLVLDADGLNILAKSGTINTLSKKNSLTVLTPHLGEFKRLFPDIEHPGGDRIAAVQAAAKASGAIILFKGAKTVIADPNGHVWLIPQSTPALARGGSGDILTGLIGGLLGQTISSFHEKEIDGGKMVATAALWHAQAAVLAAKERTELGVDAVTLSNYLHQVNWNN
ncbi:MAG: NAD(P)H-hydrate dehydratase [cyanobacterium endosymbiont of Rhopalodia musculus]|uniref:NAD(P)H-hydrate dehydratase n=1 Tax=cyanobacterium endosymbiont of Epithemia clementina EcSB TaxID=3034674 RepID=UPI0024813284|nr:NAD(P)H-hydrate dehydratase [cyanobacterium endosymbiont of Epithemia clementina EcSB]WGT66985.1 NAD(P)H-hydrate dehydratase [cyanobacterium endosymbiont of Epithemia clementina EcSB]